MQANPKSNLFTNLQLIFYQIGEGGNFLSRLFSLSPNTIFLWHTGTCGCIPKDHSLEEKLKYYNYTEEIRNWMVDAHLTPSVNYMVKHYWKNYWEHNNTLIGCVHYHEYNSNMFQNFLQKNINYFSIKMTENCRNYLRQQLNLSHSPIYNTEEIIKSKNFNYIDMDLLLSNNENFLNEYKRICNLMNIDPIDSSTVINFFENWKKYRKKFSYIALTK